MSLLIDVLKNVEKAKDTKKNNTITPEVDTSNSSSTTMEDDELFMVEITDDEEPKTASSDFSQTSDLNWDEELFEEFKDIVSEPETTTHVSDITDEFATINGDLEEPFSPFEDDKTQPDSTTHDWDEEFLPQFKDDDEQSNRFQVPVTNGDSESVNEPAPLESNLDEQLPAESKPNQLTPSTTGSVDNDWPDFENSASLAQLDFNLDDEEQSTDEFTSPTTDNGNAASLAHKNFDLDEEQSTDPKAELLAPTTENDLSETVAKGSYQPEDAQHLLAASSPPTSSKRTLWLFGVLGILLVSMGSGYYYYSQFLLEEPSFSSFKKPRPPLITASTLEPDSNPADTSSPEQNSPPSTPTQLPSVPKEPNSEPIQPVATPNATTPLLVAKSAVKSRVAKMDNVVVPEKTLTKSSTPSKTASKKRSSEKQTLHKTSAPPSRNQSSPPEFSQPNPKAVNPSLLTEASSPKTPGIYTLRKDVTPKFNNDLSTGYTAFQRGDDRTAYNAYQRALEQDNNNRDALLGLAALAWRSNNVRLAQYYYQRVLRLYPQDTHAQVGLINTLNNQSKESESQLKLLQEQAPQSAYIHFSLGNIYASQGRWAPAQQAYFDALRYDKNQADYAYNLAISLDHLNQPRIALSYYQRALQLAQNQPVRFSQNAVQKRVQTIMDHTRSSALANLPAK